MLHFATLFDSNYLTRGLALISSLSTNCSVPYKMYILALDEKVTKYFICNKLDNIFIISINDLESCYPELNVPKSNRSKFEYYFTLSPILPLYILDNFPKIDRIVTLDADLFFFGDPFIIINKYSYASVLITPHNFSNNLLHLEEYGKYNVSFQIFKNDLIGRACLEQWKSNCIEWCYDYLDVENGRYADQKYLDTWISDYEAVPIELYGTGLAPWNIQKYSFEIRSKKIFVDGFPLIYFHFHHLRIFNKYFAINGLNKYKVKMKNKILKRIYHPYLKKLLFLSSKIRFSDDKIDRINVNYNDNLFRKLISNDGMWFFTNSFIISLNLTKLGKILNPYLKNNQ